MAIECLINNFYTLLCRDPDTGLGGLTPTESEYHIDHFVRLDKDVLEKQNNTAIDRKVQVIWDGGDKFGSLTNGYGAKRHKFVNIKIRIGYYVGDHYPYSSMIMGRDEFAITKHITKPSNYPTCSEGCVIGIDPLGSSTTHIDGERKIVEITLQCQIYQ